MATPNMSMQAEDIDKSVMIGTLPTGEISESDFMAFYDVSASSEPKQRKISFANIVNAIKNIIGALPTASFADKGKPIIVGNDGTYQLGDSLAETAEIIYISASDWHSLSDSAPYMYYAEKTALTEINTNSTVELINNNPVQFAKYGLAIDSVLSQTIRFLACSLPDTGVVMRVVIHG